MDKVFKVAVFGLAPNEQKSLGSIFKLAASRSRKYSLADKQEQQVDILLVDMDDPDAVGQWEKFQASSKGMPFVKVTKNPTADMDGPILRRPLTLKRVLETLDKVTIEVLDYFPELTVGANESDSDGAAANALESAASSARKTADSGIKALVVDDSAAVRKSMEIQLGLFGMQIDFAETGEEALEQTKQNVDYDIIFLDIMMPGIDGYKVCKTFRADRRLKKTPIIMLTGKGSRFDKLKGTMAGASLYLTKPVEQNQLQDVIKKFVPQLRNAS